METWRLTAKRITKYNPLLRNEDDVYLNNEWTSFHDIGREFNGNILTLEEYLKTELKYIQAVSVFLQSIDCNEIVIEKLEKNGSNGLDKELLQLYNDILDGAVFNREKSVNDIVRLVLRENIWCEIFCRMNRSYAIRFGFDYYMYFNGEQLEESMFDHVRRLGLFVEL